MELKEFKSRVHVESLCIKWKTKSSFEGLAEPSVYGDSNERMSERSER